MLKEVLNYSVNDILKLILRMNAKTYTYIILGASPRTGKTWLCNALKDKGFNAFEISEEICSFVEYRKWENYCVIDEFKKQAVIILNHPLDK